MICDWDDFHEGNHLLDRFFALKDANPRFRCTVFAVPAFCSPEFLEMLPDWIEVAPHGLAHGGPDCSNPREAQDWTYEHTMEILLALHPRFVEGWKSPGWQISDGTYRALRELGWWCADHPENEPRRPEGLRVHVLGDGDHWHGHVQNVCDNGLEETWDELLAKVIQATEFHWISEVVAPWRAKVAA